MSIHQKRNCFFPVVISIVMISFSFKSAGQKVTHDFKGFYCVLNGGIVGGEVASKLEEVKVAAFGNALALDINAGTALGSLTLIHVSGLLTVLNNPRIQYGSSATKEKIDELTVYEYMLGGGVTGAFRKNGAFISGNVGVGFISIHDSEERSKATSDPGFSFQFKAGIDFWYASYGAISLAAMYAKTITSDDGDTWSTNRIGVLLGLKFN